MFLIAEGGEVGLELSREQMQGTTRAGDEAVELCPFQKSADEADAASALEMKSGKGSQKNRTQVVFADGGAKEGSEEGIDIGGVLPTQPVAEGGARDTKFGGILPLGRGIGKAEVVVGVGGIGPRPTKRVCARGSRPCAGHPNWPAARPPEG